MGGVASDVMGEVTVDDASLALARFENGALGTFEATRFCAGPQEPQPFEINGSLGSLVFNAERPNELEIYTEDTRTGTNGFRTVSVTGGQDHYTGHYWPTAHNIGYEHTFTNLLYDAFTRHRQRRKPLPQLPRRLPKQRAFRHHRQIRRNQEVGDRYTVMFKQACGTLFGRNSLNDNYSQPAY